MTLCLVVASCSLHTYIYISHLSYTVYLWHAAWTRKLKTFSDVIDIVILVAQRINDPFILHQFKALLPLMGENTLNVGKFSS